jgi:hypothetical protein
MARLFRAFAKEHTKHIQNLDRFVSEWPARTRALRGYLSFLAANYVLHAMLERIPKKEEWKAYRMALRVYKVTGADAVDAVYSIRVDLRHRAVRKVDPPKSILFVKVPKKMRTPKREIVLLEKYNPWTYDTIPFVPSKADAVVIVRRVATREAVRVAKEKVRVLKKIRVEMARVGKRMRKASKVHVSKRASNIPDVVFEALKLEFGLGGAAKPHWRPAIRDLIGPGLRRIKRTKPDLSKALLAESFTGWKKWPPRTRRSLRHADAKLFIPFQKKLNIRPNS